MIGIGIGMIGIGMIGIRPLFDMIVLPFNFTHALTFPLLPLGRCVAQTGGLQSAAISSIT